MNEKELESVYVDITARNSKLFRIGSLYQAPNTEVKKLMDHLELITSKVKSNPNCELIMGMDQNLDLLKSDEHYNTSKFLDQVLDCNLWPVIT